MPEKGQSISTRMRMPYLSELLARRTRPPLDLWCFYVFLDRMGNGEQDLLDFWLDVHQHKALCKAYFKDLQRTRVSVEKEWPDYWNWARQHGSLYADLAGLQDDSRFDDSGEYLETGDEEKRRTRGSFDENARGFSGEHAREGEGEEEERLGNTTNHRERRDTESHGPRVSETGYGHSTALPPSNGQPRDRRISQAPAVIRKNQAVAQMDLFTSAERIYARYLMDNAEKPVYLPGHLRLNDFPHPPQDPHSCDPRIPDYFNAQQEYVFKELEQQYYPIFLREKGFGNLTRPGVYGSLIAGLFSLWAAFVVAFTLVFYDYKPKIRRLGLIVPFFFAFYFLLSAYYALAPHLVLFKRSEVGFFKTVRIRESYIQKLHVGRASIIMVFTILATAVMTVIWWAVPGHRL